VVLELSSKTLENTANLQLNASFCWIGQKASKKNL